MIDPSDILALRDLLDSVTPPKDWPSFLYNGEWYPKEPTMRDATTDETDD